MSSALITANKMGRRGERWSSTCSGLCLEVALERAGERQPGREVHRLQLQGYRGKEVIGTDVRGTDVRCMKVRGTEEQSS